MFIFEHPPIKYQDPWTGSFSDRIKLLGLGTTKKIAYFYNQVDNSTFRYRVYNMITVIMQKLEGVSASFFTDNDLDLMDQVINQCNILVLCRVKYSNRINTLITRAKGKGVRVIFDVDDLVFNTDYTQLILNTLDQDLNHPGAWDFWFAYIGRIGATLKLCDEAITTNEFLAEQIRLFAGVKTHIIPNFVNEEQLKASQNVYEQKIACSFKRDGFLHLGYFSGTPSHNRDFAILTNSLIKLFKTRDDIKLVIAGYIDIKDELIKYKDRIIFHPFQDYVNLQQLIASVEVNLIPLQNNTFTNCKSELKYFEAAIGGTLSVASKTYTYKKAITEGVNGYLSGDIEWVEKILKLAELVGNGGYADMVESARTHAIDNYAWFNQGEKILNMIEAR
ncbi:MAG: glycosyl transferase group 1 [Burkholderiales bacterium]|jgi:glycosyltransferase involved in cell wall biosynthesis|nr:glycosyl transferase group 1 [Burkholderiales bacterium]